MLGPFDVGQPPQKESLVNFISFDSQSSWKTFVFRFPRHPAVSERHHRSAVGRRPIEKMAGWRHEMGEVMSMEDSKHCRLSALGS